MKKLLFHIFIFALAGGVFGSCENKEYLYRDISARLYLSSESWVDGPQTLSADSLRFSFRLLDDDQQEATVWFVAHLTGQAADRDREFALEVVADSTNVSQGEYSIGATVLPAGAFEVRVPVIIKRDVAGLDLTDVAGNVTARLMVRVAPNENFLAGPPDYYGALSPMNFQYFTVTWCDYLTRPVSYNRTIEQAIGPFSQARYKFYIDFTGETEFYDYNDIGRANALAAALRQALQEYNALADSENRPHYLDDDGTELTF